MGGAFAKYTVEPGFPALLEAGNDGVLVVAGKGKDGKGKDGKGSGKGRGKDGKDGKGKGKDGRLRGKGRWYADHFHDSCEEEEDEFYQYSSSSSSSSSSDGPWRGGSGARAAGLVHGRPAIVSFTRCGSGSSGPMPVSMPDGIEKGAQF